MCAPDPDLVRLNLVRGITPRAAASVLAAFGSAADAFRAPEADLAALGGVGGALAARLRDPPRDGAVRKEIRRARRRGIRLLHPDREGYPVLLREIPDPPVVLSVKGELPPDADAVAVVGARRAGVYGRVQAERFAAGLARSGVVVVSGLARGVDGAAHRGALDAGGRTGAVLGCGLDRVYPPEHGRLAREVSESGFLCSEFPLGTPPRAHHFPMRNRIIAGLSRAILVVEGRIRSGSLITAGLAGEFGRDVYALPGRVDSDLSAGPHYLLRDGAILATGPAQILEDLGRKPLADTREPGPPADPVQAAVLALLDPSEPLGVDEVLRATDADAPAVLAALVELELSGRIRAVEGRRYVAAGATGP